MNSHQVVALLNELIALDRDAIEKLIAARVQCNQALADHPSVQVLAVSGDFWVGMLGVLNGIYGCNQESVGYIEAHLDDNQRLVRFLSKEPQ